MKKDLDEILKQALTPSDEPDFWLNQRILNQAEEAEKMNMKHVKRIPAAVLAAAVVLGAGSVTAYAAWQYLTPEKVTENMQNKKLMTAFQGEDAVKTNEKQSFGGYQVTFLGVVSGKDISEFEQSYNGTLCEDRTYSVTAVEYADGTPMPDTSDDAYADLSFFVSPLIKGCDPNRYNAVTMRGGYTEFVENGILYRLTECDNVEIFADHGLYLCVCDGTFYNQKAYHYDEVTGEISRNEEYEGLNALFSLPIDAAKADQKAAAEYLTVLEEEEENPEKTVQEEEILQTTEEKALREMIHTWMDQLTPENIDQYAERVESTVQILEEDEEGMMNYKYKVEGRSSGSSSFKASWFLKDAKPGMLDYFDYNYSGDGLDSLTIETFTLNEDGTVTFAVYIPKES